MTAGAPHLLAVTLPAPVMPIDRAARAPIGGSVLRWESPEPERDGKVWSYAGFGEAARIDADGEARFEALRIAAAQLFARVTERRRPGVTASSLRLYGGLAFRPEPQREAPWAAFRDASFVLPRVLYGTDGEHAFLRVVSSEAVPFESLALEQMMAALLLPPGPPATTPPMEASLERTSVDVWSAMISDALARIRAQEFTKVVPMALCRVVACGVLDPADALARMGAQYPECVRFAFQRGDAVFLGASPERLVGRRGLAVEADALAGSAPRRAAGDAGAVAALLASDKDRREHRFVVDAVEAALAPLSASIQVPRAPMVRTLRNVHHLWTPIAATLTSPVHVLDLVRALHPTPAVSGTPRDAAVRWIASHEPAPRGWYAGAVGWLDAEGDGAFSVAIRSGLLSRREAWLYAGAGIVEGSDPAAEYAETRVKQAPMLAALGLAVGTGIVEGFDASGSYAETGAKQLPMPAALGLA